MHGLWNHFAIAWFQYRCTVPLNNYGTYTIDKICEYICPCKKLLWKLCTLFSTANMSVCVCLGIPAELSAENYFKSCTCDHDMKASLWTDGHTLCWVMVLCLNLIWPFLLVQYFYYTYMNCFIHTYLNFTLPFKNTSSILRYSCVCVLYMCYMNMFICT